MSRRRREALCLFLLPALALTAMPRTVLAEAPAAVVEQLEPNLFYPAQVSVPFAASTDPARTRAEIEVWHYNSDYLFGLSRRVASGGAIPAVRPILFVFTIPLDLVLLPFAAIGGLFG